MSAQAMIFLATNRPGVTRATRSSGEWHTDRLMPHADVRCLARDPRQPNVVFAGTQGEGILRSVDQGLTWEPLAFAGKIVKSIAFSKSQPDTVYAGLKPPAVWKSTDGGTSWMDCPAFQSIPSLPEWWSPAEPPGTAYVQGITVHPDNPAIVLAGIEFGAVVRSEDGGQTWSDHRPGAIEDCHILMFHPTHGDYAYEAGGNGNGGAISHDGGKTWEQPIAGLDGRHYGWGTAADPMIPATWYVAVSPGPDVAHRDGTAQAAIFRSREGGAWEKLGGGLPDPIPHMPYGLLTDPTAPGHLYAGLRNGDIWFSSDWGDSWQQLPVNVGHLEHSLLMITSQG